MASIRPSIIANETGVTISITDQGRFEIVDQKLDWTFSGGIGARPFNLTAGKGCDRAGAYQALLFAFRSLDGNLRRGTIRLYDHRDVVMFELEFVDSGTTDEAFPSLAQYPRKLHHLAYTGTFGGFSFTRFGTDGPWMFFDDDKKTFILSPGSHFLNTSLRRGSHGQLRSEVVCSDKRIPPGFLHTTVLAMAPGINRAFEVWGHFLTDLTGKTRPPNDGDLGLKYLGYWTDRGAHYYYHFEPRLSYGATLLKIQDDFHKAHISLGYMQIDSWFYPKGRDGKWRTTEQLGGGTYLYEAAPEIFPEGLRALQQKLRLPLITHNRWIDPNSPYRGKYAISGNVSIDPTLWTIWMRYLSQSGVRTYEQDWLSGPAQPERTLDAGERFMDLMAHTAETEGMTLQYCMPLPRHFLQGTKYANLTTIRTSGDRLTERTWKSFLFNGRLATALGEWPWADVCMSSETTNLLLATLSGGMVGVGDAVGQLDPATLLHAVRPDGVIVKPDDALTPLDASYIAQAKDRSAPVIAVARTNHHGWITSYVFGFRASGGGKECLSPAELGYVGPVYAYNYFQNSGAYLDLETPLHISISDLPAYWIVVPVAASGIGFLGDQDKFVSNGKQRVADILDDGVLSARIILAENEERVRLHGFAFPRPELRARQARIENMTYDSRRRLFQFDLVARAGGSPEFEALCPRAPAL